MFTDDSYEQFWDALLSRQPERIRAAFFGLDAASQAEVLRHLHRELGGAFLDWDDDLLVADMLCVDAAIRLLGGEDAMGVAGVG